MSDQANQEHQGPDTAPRRRVIFPWAWLGLLIGGRLAFQLTDAPGDFKVIANYLTFMVGVAGLCFWYVVRGRGWWPVRLAVGAAPFAAMYLVGVFFEVRMAGDGNIVGLHLRGAEKADQRLAAPVESVADEGLTDWGPGEYDYPRFLGDGPWAEAIGPPIDPDWDANPPQEMWRRTVGAGWSAFAVQGRYAVTQEQRGEEELVVCYAVESGEPVWSHADAVRFDPADFGGQMGRTGPRATPTIVGDRVYTQGATGIVNCLDGRTGDVAWSVDTGETYGAAVPVWGKSGSPLYAPSGEDLANPIVVVNVGAPIDSAEGEYDASLVAFDAASGEEVWAKGWRQTSYASPQLVTLHGERVVLQTSDDVLTAHAIADGSELFSYPWPGVSDNLPSCSQPIVLTGDRLLMSKGYGFGASLITVGRDGGSWSAEPLWSPAIKRVLQTKFSNVVVRDGHAYALSDKLLQCVDVETGDIAWRARRSPAFKYGQVLLAGDKLLVMTEDSGEIVLAEAKPDRFTELAALQVLAAGETCWNNPVVAGDVLLVRNAVEAAAYRLPVSAAEAAAAPVEGVAAR